MKKNSQKTNWGQAINFIAIIIVVIFALLLIASKFNIGGLKFLVVKSGSMEPVIKTGSFITVKKSPSYEIGNIINFKNPTNLTETTTHRISNITINETNQTVYTTKGDANNAPDNKTITTDNINGKVVFTLPYLGYLVAFTQTGLGIVLLIIIPATIIVYEEFLNIKKEISDRIKKGKRGGNK